jgi:hypothetical protein
MPCRGRMRELHIRVNDGGAICSIIRVNTWLVDASCRAACGQLNLTLRLFT